MKKISFILLAWLPFVLFLCMGAWDNTLPADNTIWNVAPTNIRDNWDALEVALGVDISMEGSASPWYQPGAPTTTADGSTALSASNNGLLWVDSDNRVLNTYVDGTGFVGVDSIPDVVTFAAGDQTPSVLVGRTFKTDSGTLRIADFDDGTAGKVITVESMGTITFDTTFAVSDSNNLDGSSADIITALGDVTVWETSGGTTWNLVRWNDASADQTDFATVTYVDAGDSGSATFTYSGSTVFNTTMTSTNTWQDLDLSAIIGSNRASVQVQVFGVTPGGIFWIKPKGLGGSPPNTLHNTNTQSGGGAVNFTADSYTYFTMTTDTSGVIQIAANNASTYTIVLLTYIK